MPGKRYRILFPSTEPQTSPYKPIRQGRSRLRLPIRQSPREHGERLYEEFSAAWAVAGRYEHYSCVSYKWLVERSSAFEKGQSQNSLFANRFFAYGRN